MVAPLSRLAANSLSNGWKDGAWRNPIRKLMSSCAAGGVFGSETFRKEMLRRAEGSLGGSHAGQLHRQGADAKAKRIIAEELQRDGWSERDFLACRKKDPAKLAIAARLRRETTLPLKAIAARLGLGTSKSANGKLHAFMKGPPGTAAPDQPQIGL